MFGVPDEIRAELQIRQQAQRAVADWVVQAMMIRPSLTEEQITKGACILARIVVAGLREVNAATAQKAVMHLMGHEGPELTMPGRAGGVMAEPSLEQQLVKLVQSWLRAAGTDIRYRDRIGFVHFLSSKPPVLQGVLACAVELLAVLESHPEGRKALPDLSGKPLFQQPKGE